MELIEFGYPKFLGYVYDPVTETEVPTWDETDIDPLVSYRLPVKPVSTRDWESYATLSVVSAYFPPDAHFAFPPNPIDPTKKISIRMRGRIGWTIEGDPEIWKLGNSPHIKVNLKILGPNNG
ncbi:hypothetical protein ACFWY5_29890 [Nonomuraea sp. NPDC059007]|uniref:hypothetical protein n=1 Tax=Nonomuraea sp. NPDC059007 TaxID=3346692 RepID=UPI0036AEB592